MSLLPRKQRAKPAGSHSGGRGGGASVIVSVPTGEGTPHRTLTLDSTATVEGWTGSLAAAGCLNPHERASELLRTGRCRFYRVDPDPAIVHVELEAP